MKKDKKVNWTATAVIRGVETKTGGDENGRKWTRDDLYLELEDLNLKLPSHLGFFRPHYQGYIPKRNDRISFVFSETDNYPILSCLEKIGEVEVDDEIKKHSQDLENIFQGVREKSQKYNFENKENIKEQKKKNQKAATELSENFWKSDKFWKRKKK